MKNIYISLALTCLIILFFACKKENKNPVIGKWQQNKIRIYELGTNGTIIKDTTYLWNTVTSLDYVQFNTNGTCITSSSLNYFSADGRPTGNSQLAASKDTLNFTSNGTQYILTSRHPIYFFVSETDTATLVDPNNLIIHDRSHGPIAGPTMIADLYYSR